MTIKHYDIAALRKSRQRIISIMKNARLQIGKHFTLSAVNSTSNMFELQPASKAATLKKQILAVFKKKLGNSVEVKSDQRFIKIILGSLYTGFINHPKSKKAVKPARKNLGSKSTDFSGFKDTLLRSIEASTNAKANDKQIGFHYTQESIEGRQSIILHCAEQFVVNEILTFLEGHNIYAKHIFSVHKHTITISFQEVKRRQSKSELQIVSLYDDLKTAITKVFRTAPKILTPRTLSVKDNQVIIEVQFMDQGDAVHFTSILNQEFTWAKEGNVITISISIARIKKVLGSVLLLDKRTKHGLLALKGKQGNPRYVHKSHRYQEFHFLPFNRKVNKKHVMRLVRSIESFGPQSFVNIAETNCVDGVKRKWIVDGQHRFMAYQFLKWPILYTVSNVSTKEEMVRLIAVLNHTSKTWHLRDYLEAWCQLGIPAYITIEKALAETKLPITVLLEMFSGQQRQVATNNFQQGKYRLRDVQLAHLHVSYLVELRPFLPRSSTIYSALAGFFNATAKNYSNGTMKERLKAFQVRKKQLPFGPEDTRDELVKKLKGIYAGTL
jgi:hypothetical protein